MRNQRHQQRGPHHRIVSAFFLSRRDEAGSVERYQDHKCLVFMEKSVVKEGPRENTYSSVLDFRARGKKNHR